MRGCGGLLQSSFILLQLGMAHISSSPQQNYQSTTINFNSENYSSIRRHGLKSDLESSTSCNNSTLLLPNLNQTTSGESRAQMNIKRYTVKKLPHKESWKQFHQHSRILLNGMRETVDGRFDHDSPKRKISSISVHQRSILSLLVPSSQDQFADNEGSTRQITLGKHIQTGDITINQVLVKPDDEQTDDYSPNTWRRRQILGEGHNDNLSDVYISRITEAAIAQCPHADFCFSQSSIIPPTGTVSCCKPCYCDSDCGRRMDCCFRSVDQTSIVKTNEMVCSSSRLTYSEHDDKNYPRYYMVDKCLTNSTSNCSDADFGSRRSLHPVYSSTADLIFVNRECAECNGVYDSTNWTVYLSCNEDASVLDNVLQGEIKQGACAMVFLPPTDAHVDKYICYNEVFDTCNVTGYWDQYDNDIKLACETVLAPIEADGYQFANVFCKLCNGFLHHPMTMCARKAWFNMIEKSEFGNLFALVDYKLYSQIATTEQDGTSTQEKSSQEIRKCNEAEVMNPITRECRAVFCPHSAVRTKKGCKLFLSKWYTPGYKVHLALTPVGNELIELSAFTRLTKRQIRNCSLWMDSSGIPLENFVFHVKTLERNNISYANHLDLETGSKSGPVEAEKTLDLIRSALSKPWKIRLDKTTYYYKASFDRLRFVYPIIKSVEYSDFVKSHEPSSEKRMVWFEELFRMYEGHFSINKLHYCEQVQLHPGEWTAVPDKQGALTTELEIKLNLTGSNDERILGNGEFNIISNRADDDNKRIRICVEDFNEQFSRNFGSHGVLMSVSVESVIIYLVLVNLFI